MSLGSQEQRHYYDNIVTFLQWMQEQNGKPKPHRVALQNVPFQDRLAMKPLSRRIVVCLGILRNFAENESLKQECNDIIKMIESYEGGTHNG